MKFLPETTQDSAKKSGKPLQIKTTQPLKSTGIKIKLGGSGTGAVAVRKPEVTKLKVSSAFCAEDDDSDGEEDMPAFAAMRMKNIGRNTPTSSGPNSFGKTKHGFCDQKKIFEKRTTETDE